MEYDTKGYYYHFLKDCDFIENLDTAISGQVKVTPKGAVAINNYKLERKQRILSLLTFIVALVTLVVTIMSCRLNILVKY